MGAGWARIWEHDLKAADLVLADRAIWEMEERRHAGRVGASGFGIWARVSVLVGQANICVGDKLSQREHNMRVR